MGVAGPESEGVDDGQKIETDGLRNEAFNATALRRSEARSSDHVQHLTLAQIEPEYQPIFAEACLEGQEMIEVTGLEPTISYPSFRPGLQEAGKTVLSTEPVPVDKYNFKP